MDGLFKIKRMVQGTFCGPEMKARKKEGEGKDY
jgi:hypothetical protein